MARYHVVYAVEGGGYWEFTEPDDAAAWRHAEESSFGKRIVSLSEIRVGNPDRIRPLDRPGMTDRVATALRKVASGLLEAADAWQDEDQAAWDLTRTQIHRGIGMSLDDLAVEIFAFVEEAEEA